MTEFDFSYEHRESVAVAFGTAHGTILGPLAPQQSLEITEIVVMSQDGLQEGGALMQFATLQGYSQFGTTTGTIVAPFQVDSANRPFIDGNGRAPIAYVAPGNILYGVVTNTGGTLATTGSVIAKIVYRPIYQRG